MDIFEKVDVIASFGNPHKIKPVRFTWSNRTVQVREVTYFWKAKEGAREIYHFSVTDGKTLFELTFDNLSLVWRLEHIEA